MLPNPKILKIADRIKELKQLQLNNPARADKIGQEIVQLAAQLRSFCGVKVQEDDDYIV